MTTQEFSNEFDTLIAAYFSKSEFGNQDALAFDEYEKSVFLTEAQERIVLDYYNGKNPFGESFEVTEEIRRYLNELINTSIQTPITHTGELLTNKSKVFSLPNDLWFITYESAILGTDNGDCSPQGKEIEIIPVTQDNFHSVEENPFRRSGFRRALRLDLADNKVEIVSNYNLDGYKVRYVKRVSPIILEALPDNLTIKNIAVKTECKLNTALHRQILNKAVELALQSKGIYKNKK